MKSYLHPRVLIPAMAALALASSSAVAQPTGPKLPPPGLEIVYTPPKDPAHQPIYERIMKRGVLEQYKEFMEPLKLPRHITISSETCGKINAWYSNGKITYCYEYMAYMENVARTGAEIPGFRREDALVGAFVQVLLHETSHMIFAQLDVPVLGREEDAADQVASFTLLNLGPTVARRALTGAAFFWRAQALKSSYGMEDFADEHGTEGQRFFNTLCLAYGSDVVLRTSTFNDFVQQKLLPEERRVRCAGEYIQAKKAFDRLILPHVDAALMKKVQGMDWLKPEDGVEAVPPANPNPDPRTRGPTGPTGPTGPGAPRGPGGPTGPTAPR